MAENPIDYNRLLVAFIPPFDARDMLGDTVLDGLLALKQAYPGMILRIPEWYTYTNDDEVKPLVLPEKEFIAFAKAASVVFLVWGKRKTNTALAEKIGVWHKTIYIDGSEVGKNRRHDAEVQWDVLHGTYETSGGINETIKAKAALYCKREKPYSIGIEPLPFGIERRYIQYNANIQKDIDIVCVFGQDEYPPLRKYAIKLVEEMGKKYGLKVHTTPSKNFLFDPLRQKGRHEFYSLLARAKIGISIGGGGFDTARFWEMLANNCLVFTERIDIFPPDSTALAYRHIQQCNNLYDIAYYIERLVPSLKAGAWPPVVGMSVDDYQAEYKTILHDHSTQARIKHILQRAADRGIIV